MTDTVAVTGAAGYVGGRLVAHLRATGSRVVAVVRRPVPWLPDAVVVDGATEPTRAIEGCNALVHLAGANEVVAGRDPEGSTAATVAAARSAAAAAVDAGVERIVHLSTVHVYGASIGDLAGAPLTEDVVARPVHPYAEARLRSEDVFASCGVPTTVLRLTNAVGPPVDPRVERWTLVANELCRAAATGGPMILRSSGQQWRDFVDLTEAVRVIGEASRGAVPAGRYNLGSGRSRTVRDLADTIAAVAEDVIGVRPAVEAPPPDGPSPPRLDVDVSRLARHVPPPAPGIEGALRGLIAQCATASSTPGGSWGHG